MKILSPVFALIGSIFMLASAHAEESKPHAVIVVGTHHYAPQVTMPAFAKELEKFGFKTTVVNSPDGDPEKLTENALPGIEALNDADLAIFFMRFLKISETELKPIVDYLESGKPLIALRTSNHAFKYGKNEPLAEWNTGFGRRATGTPYVVSTLR